LPHSAPCDVKDVGDACDLLAAVDEAGRDAVRFTETVDDGAVVGYFNGYARVPDSQLRDVDAAVRMPDLLAV